MFLLGCNDCKGNYTFGPLIGRVLLGLVFLIAGITKILNFNESIDFLESLGFLHAHFLTYVALVIEIVAGLMVVFGCYTRIGTLVLIVFLLIVTFMVHHFWTMGIDRGVNFQDFFQNASIIGGLVLLLCYGPGSISLDALRHCSHGATTKRKSARRKTAARKTTKQRKTTKRRRA